MSNVLFLGVPSHGHVNPTLGLVSELIRRGQNVTYFSSLAFKEKIESAGASFRCYAHDLDMFKAPQQDASEEPWPLIARVVQSGLAITGDILEQTREQKFDCLIHSAPFPFAKPIAQLLNLPTVSSLAVFAGLDAFFGKGPAMGGGMFSRDSRVSEALKQTGREFADLYGLHLPETSLELLFNKGDLNLVYTSAYFAANLTYFDHTYKFVGPPMCDRQEQADFPFDRLVGKRVLYISLGTEFAGRRLALYGIFFESFADWDGIVVMAAYGVDHSKWAIPGNFVVKNYVPQGELLKYATVAITHCGMDSLSDLLAHEIPFVSLPLGADQPALSARAQELGATIALDAKTLLPEELKSAVETLMREPAYLHNIKKIADSFKSAGGYKKAVDEIIELKRARSVG